MGKKTVPVFILLVTLVILMSLSSERTFVESCTVIVRASNGEPAQSVRVSETWNAYSYDMYGGGDSLTDDQGRVFFPKRSARRSQSYWLLRPILTQLYYGVHAGSGIDAFISVSQPGKVNPDGFSCSDKKCSESPLELQFQIMWE